jgi:hypothetical protein
MYEKGQIEEPVKKESDWTKFVELFCWSKKVPTLKWRLICKISTLQNSVQSPLLDLME